MHTCVFIYVHVYIIDTFIDSSSFLVSGRILLQLITFFLVTARPCKNSMIRTMSAWKCMPDTLASRHQRVVNDTMCFSFIRRENTVLMLQRSTPSISLMWSEGWPHSVATVPWALLRLSQPVFPAHRDTTWPTRQECVRAARQTPSSGPISLSERLLVFHVDQTRRQMR